MKINKLLESKKGFLKKYRDCSIHDMGNVFVATNKNGLNIGQSKTKVGIEAIIDDYMDKQNNPIKEDASYEWKPNTSFKHIKDIYEKVKANGYKYVNNEREEFMAAVKKADAKGYKPEQCRQIKEWHREIWQHNRKTESYEGTYSDKFRNLIKQYEEEGVSTSGVINDIIRYCPEEDLKDLWFDRGYARDFDKDELTEDSRISKVEPKVRFNGKSAHTFTKDKKWEVDFDEEGNILARTRHGNPYYFKGHINDKVNDFPSTDEDNIILAAREQHGLKFGEKRENELKEKRPESIKESCDKTLNEGPNVSINDLKTFYSTATGIDREKYPNFFVWYDAMVKSGKYKREDVNDKSKSIKSLDTKDKKSNELAETYLDDFAANFVRANSGIKASTTEFYNDYVIIKNQAGDGYDIYSYNGTPENVKKTYLEDEGYATVKDAKAEIDKWHNEARMDETVVPSSIDFDDDIDNLSYYYDDDSFDEEDSIYVEVASKSVPDMDGFMTDYTMYLNKETGEYVFIFGDNDIYTPENTDPDWESETEEQAIEWFDHYNGFADDIDESYLKEEENKSPIVHKKSDGSYLVASEDGKSYVAYNKDDACMGNISANNETEAKNKFNSNTFDE